MYTIKYGNGSFLFGTQRDGLSRVRQDSRTIDRRFIFPQNGYQISRIHPPLPKISNQPNTETSILWVIATNFSPARPFHTLIIDFILILPESTKKFNCTMSVTDKFSKTVIYILKKKPGRQNNEQLLYSNISFYSVKVSRML